MPEEVTANRWFATVVCRQGTYIARPTVGQDDSTRARPRFGRTESCVRQHGSAVVGGLKSCATSTRARPRSWLIGDSPAAPSRSPPSTVSRDDRTEHARAEVFTIGEPVPDAPDRRTPKVARAVQNICAGCLPVDGIDVMNISPCTAKLAAPRRSRGCRRATPAPSAKRRSASAVSNTRPRTPSQSAGTGPSPTQATTSGRAHRNRRTTRRRALRAESSCAPAFASAGDSRHSRRS